MVWSEKLYINRQNGDEERPVNKCGGRFRTVITFMKPRQAGGSVPASSAVGACACPAGGRKARGESDRFREGEAGRRRGSAHQKGLSTNAL